ncbi:uncharacterized protein SPSK_05346 [Sporothrix schenckii 1099-18]|uniref:Uncharacterized protein n=1 Tax=Sporothrix schenckii 1099-18 TaxID=1397361 RepID=A0A0F2LYP5_SPOSC|nr:uncharacterized protein SPSK_05346 [Sporothrix schenckii 1099-18]KJR81011.1 hypothetical protein SPSK_05346 [Sporothrix schenckii 1099-18]
MSTNTQPEEAPQWQRETHNEYFYNLCDLKFALEDEVAKYTATLTNEQLSSLFISVLDDLNVDDEAPLDFGPSFFAPLPQGTFDKFLETYGEHLYPPRYDDGTNMNWNRLCGMPSLLHCDGTCPADEPKDRLDFTKRECDGHLEAQRRATWLESMYQYRERRPGGHALGISALANWVELTGDRWCNNQHHSLRAFTCSNGTTHHQHVTSRDARVDLSGLVPHATMVVAEPCAFGATDVLLGDVLAAVELMRRQVRYHEHLSHRIFPHDTTARIVQAHFDGHRLFIRQSRLLDLNADEPTPDAYLLLRWMASRPQGNTEYGKPFCTDDAPMAITTKEPEEPSSAVAVLG